ncbi:MAG: excinuclease ABC subunit UvrA [Bacteroidota bacterium]
MAKAISPSLEVSTADDLFHEDFIQVVGAREHNLKDIDVAIPRNQLVVITGISGSGKSSLAFDTIYAEGQRRYMETFSAYARQFIGEMERPEVEQITGLSPVISIEQKTTGRNPRSTVGTVTEVYDFLRLLYARIGEAYSYQTGKKMVSYTEEQILDQIFSDFKNRKISVLSPLVRGRKGHYRELFEQMRKQGYTKMRIDGAITDLTPGLQVDRYKVHDIELVVDRLKVGEERKDRLANSLQTALKMGNDLVMIADHEDDRVMAFSKNLMDAESGLSYEEPSPNTFSFNSPYGYCKECKGLGVVNRVDLDKVIPDDTKSINDAGIAPFGEVRDNMTFKQLRAIAKKYNFSFSTPIKEIPEKALETILHGGDDSFRVRGRSKKQDFSYNLAKEGLVPMLKRWYDNSTSEKVRRWAEDFMTISTCPSCNGQRLRKEALHFKINEKNIADLAEMDLVALNEWMQNVDQHLSERQLLIARDILKEIRFRLEFLLQVGLDYLSLNRPGRTLSGGEAQRIRLATQIGSQLTGITYILDEPSIGLHQRDNQRLIDALRELTDIGNTVIVVEHDRDIMLASDFLIDLGPGAGRLGGELVAQGKPDQIVSDGNTITANYLSRKKDIMLPAERRKGSGKFLELKGASGNNLKEVNIKIPLGTFTCVTGVSGSGKSTLINETLYPILRQHFYRSLKPPMPYKEFKGLEHIDKVIEIDQSPIGRTPRSNPATYTGVFTDIRSLFSNLPEAKIRGYKPGRFSFNVKGGRCETCQGSGMRRIEMNFLPDVYVECETCLGRRYNRETLEILYKGKSINDVLEMSVTEAVEFFEHIPKIFRKLKTLKEVGLGYITLGQQATTLSGGEAQRVKLAEELSKRDTGNTVYILDEPTTGLHFEDIQYLLKVLNRLVDKGNTVIVIEHNLDVIKVADYILDMGPEGGRRGGTLVTSGTPEQVAKQKKSHTGHHLKIELKDSKK